MKNISTKLNLFSLLILTIISGCNAPVDENVMVMEVNSLKVPCEGVGLRTCLQVKYEGDENWQLFYSNIEGFTYEEGYLYKIKVEKRERDKQNMPMDVSSFTYHLKSVVEKTKDASILLNDIWGLEAIWTDEKEELLEQNTFKEGNPTLELNTKTMTFSGHDGCNTYRGNITHVDQKTLVLGNALGTKMSCPDMDKSLAFMQNLSKVNGYSYKDLRLTLYQDDKPVLRFQKLD